MITLEHDNLLIQVSTKGAELCRLYGKAENLEYLWHGDPAYWGKHSPVLFPIVGTLVNNTYNWQGKNYSLPRHGFARDTEFTLAKQTTDSVVLNLSSTAETLQHYPFHFSLTIVYQISGSMLRVKYIVQNNGDTDMPFSLGAHPAFNLPLVKGDAYHDYLLSFSGGIDSFINPLQNGLLLHEKQKLGLNNNTLPLQTSLFEKDALVFTGKMPDSVRVSCTKNPHGFELHMKGWPHLGLWAAPNAPFLCIEPWQGHADFADHQGDISQKPGIIMLAPKASWERSWQVTCF